MKSQLPKHLQNIVEALCEPGCENVNKAIELLSNDNDVAETSDLSALEKTQVLNELKTIMSVYDDQND